MHIFLVAPKSVRSRRQRKPSKGHSMLLNAYVFECTSEHLVIRSSHSVQVEKRWTTRRTTHFSYPYSPRLMFLFPFNCMQANHLICRAQLTEAHFVLHLKSVVCIQVAMLTSSPYSQRPMPIIHLNSSYFICIFLWVWVFFVRSDSRCIVPGCARHNAAMSGG